MHRQKYTGGELAERGVDVDENHTFDTYFGNYCTAVAESNLENEVTEYECSDPNTWVLADQSSLSTYWGYATNGALADRYFQPMAGGTSGNDMYLAFAHWQFTDNTSRP